MANNALPSCFAYHFMMQGRTMQERGLVGLTVQSGTGMSCLASPILASTLPLTSAVSLLTLVLTNGQHHDSRSGFCLFSDFFFFFQNKSRQCIPGSPMQICTSLLELLQLRSQEVHKLTSFQAESILFCNRTQQSRLIQMGVYLIQTKVLPILGKSFTGWVFLIGTLSYFLAPTLWEERIKKDLGLMVHGPRNHSSLITLTSWSWLEGKHKDCCKCQLTRL
ncbi:hypothetical protein LINPERPRIM_LOCUS2712 [Linum perenne]